MVPNATEASRHRRITTTTTTTIHRRRPPHFKATLTVDDNRRSRDETTIHLRKQKKDDILQKRRGMIPSSSSSSSSSTGAPQTTNDSLFSNTTATTNGGKVAPVPPIEDDQMLLSQPLDLATAHQLCQPLLQWKYNPTSVSYDALYQATCNMRHYSTTNTPIAVPHIVNCGAIPILVELLGLHDYPDLIVEVAWILTNVASTKNMGPILLQNPLPTLSKLCDLLNHTNCEVREQAIWCLGNLASESAQIRDAILYTPGFVEHILCNLTSVPNRSMLSTVSFTTSNVFAVMPTVPIAIAQQFIPKLVELVKNCEIYKLTATDRHDTLWALLRTTEGSEDHLQCGVDHGMVPILMNVVRDFLSCPDDKKVLVPALRTLGNVAASTDNRLNDLVLQAGILDVAMMLMDNPSKQIRKDICWILSNIATGTPLQATKLFANRDLVLKVIDFCLHATWCVQREAMWALCNLAANLSLDDLHNLTSMGALEVLVKILRIMDREVALLTAALGALERIFIVCGQHSLVLFDELGGLDPLEELQNHRSEQVYKMSVDLIKHFNDDDDDDIDVDISPAIFDESFSLELPSKQLFPDGSPSSTVPPVSFNFTDYSPFSPGTVGATARV